MEEISTIESTPPKTVWFWNSHRFWAAVSAAGVALSQAAGKVATINPIAGVVCEIAGIGCGVIGAVGIVWFVKTSDRKMVLRNSNGNSK